MPITFSCQCGKTLKVGDEHAGKRVKCPSCNGVADVPAAAKSTASIAVARPAVAKAIPAPAAKPKPPPPDDDFEVVDDDDDPPPKKKSSRRDEDDDYEDERPSKRKSRRDEDDEEEDERPSKRKSKRAVAADDEEEDERPSKRKKNKKKSKRKSKSDANGGKRLLYIGGGILAIVAGAALAYFLSDAGGRGATKLMFLGVAIALGGIGAIFNGITGNMGDDEKEDEEEKDEEKDEWDDE